MKFLRRNIIYLQKAKYSTISFFDNSKEIYKNIPTGELKKTLRILQLCRNPLIAQMGPKFVPYMPKSLTRLTTRPFFNHFCGGETLEDCIPVINNLFYNRNLKVCLDYAVEGIDEGPSNNQMMEETCNRIIKTLQFASEHREKCLFGVVKFSGIFSVPLLEKISEILCFYKIHKDSSSLPEILSKDGMEEYIPPRTITFPKKTEMPILSENEIQMLKEGLQRLHRIGKSAKELRIPVFVDAEQTWLQPAIDHIIMHFASIYNDELPIFFTTYQMYLKHSLSRLKFDFEFSKKRNIFWGYKLVRGAYLKSETERVSSLQLEENPIHDGIERTHHDFHKAIQFSLDGINDGISFNIASHNKQSMEFLKKEMEKRNLKPNDERISVSQLYGMGDYLSLALANCGYTVAKYLPFGPIMEVIPFLVRRLQENSALIASSIHEINLLKKEIKRRNIYS